MATMNFSTEHSACEPTLYEGARRPGECGASHVSSEDWIPVGELWTGASEFAGMVVQSPQMQRLVDYLSRIAPYKATVLIQGESGTGKELVAQALHRLGPTPHGPFV